MIAENYANDEELYDEFFDDNFLENDGKFSFFKVFFVSLTILIKYFRVIIMNPVLLIYSMLRLQNNRCSELCAHESTSPLMERRQVASPISSH
jgi:hypothetical protein